MDKRIAVVIPMREGSKRIPGKNFRFINGRPLMSYSISNALKLREFYDVDVVVSTDDEEISYRAERLGAEVVMRPDELATDEVTLDPVIYHAVCSMEQKKGKYDVVITLQATSPTLRFNTIKKAFDYFFENAIDTVISGVNDTHLAWTKMNGKTVPLYEKRLNSQELPIRYKETGGFLITKREYVTKTSRIGQKVFLYEIPQEEAIDIDSELDWIACEGVLKAKKIIMRADGKEELGMGHIYRTLSLACHMTGHDILFVTNKHDKIGLEKIKSSYFNYLEVENNDDIFDIIKEHNPDIIINDILDTDINYMRRLKKTGIRIVNFEDAGAGSRYADVVINALYTETSEKNVYSGFEYYFIRDEFMMATPKAFSREVKNIVMMFGGSDPSDLTRKMIRIIPAIARKSPQIEFHIITGFGYKYKNVIHDDEENNIFIHNDVKMVSKYLEKADLAITSQGRTIFEVARMQVPTIVLAHNQREMEHIFGGFANGFINLGVGSLQEDEAISSTIEWIIKSPNIRQQMHEVMKEKDFTKGQERVLKLILGE